MTHERHDQDKNGNRRIRRRNIMRTVLILAAAVLLIYAIFVGQGIWSHFSS